MKNEFNLYTLYEESEMMCILYRIEYIALQIENTIVKVIPPVTKQLKQLQRKHRNNSEASMGFKLVMLKPQNCFWAFFATALVAS